MRQPRRPRARKRRDDGATGDLFAKSVAAKLADAVKQAFESPAAITESDLSARAPMAPAAPSPIDPPALLPPTDEPLPARMLNEFVYCPRLFYYEHVEGVFVENADTLRGSTNHQRVDGGSGAMPAAEKAQDGAGDEETAVIHARSVSLGSDRLGVTAKLDLVEVGEGADGSVVREVCPVDYKAGAPRVTDDGNEIWPADRMQLGLQILLLRDNGYACDSGIIYYRKTKQRVPLEMTTELESWVTEQIAAARAAILAPMPAPLVDSPKCPRCSLVTVCLPDETHLLSGIDVAAVAAGVLPAEISQGTPPRRLMAVRDERRALYLNTPGLHVGRSGEVLQIRDKKTVVQEVRLTDVSHVAVFGNVQISTQTIQAMCERDQPVAYFSSGGWFYAITRGHSLTNVFLRVAQFQLARDPVFCLRVARQFVQGKIRNQRTMLMRNHLEPPAAALQRLKVAQEDLAGAESLETLLGMEGAAARVYFQHLGGMLKHDESDEREAAMDFDFNGRNRRPPTDPVNALLSLAYSLLAKDCTVAALAVGFDPYIGFYHQPRHSRPALALDLMEEFRPLIAESAVLSAINTRMVTIKDFVRAGRAVNLTPAGRRRFFEAYEKRMGIW